MVTVKRLAALAVLGILPICPWTGRSEVPRDHVFISEDRGAANSLFAQSAAQALTRDFDRPAVSFLLLDARTGALLASRWDDPEKRIPMGSLVKPFTALAYGQQHEFHYPAHVCMGETSGCWRPSGHGTVDLTSAIANSCNSYFRMLTSGMNGSQAAPVARQFGLDEPGPRLHDAALFGLSDPALGNRDPGNQWLISPLHMARAYVELARLGNQPGIVDILAGMAQSARDGTGREAGRALRTPNALVKTGTAPCTHPSHAPGDGFVVALFPADAPDFLLLVRVHGVPGSRAAATAGEMLHRIEE